MHAPFIEPELQMPRNAVKVVIVGGGCAGLATAWQLSKLNAAKRADAGTPEVSYDITVYEQTGGWVARALVARRSMAASSNTACTSGSGSTRTRFA